MEWIGKEHLEELLKANPYMYEIYPTEEGRSHLQVFRFKNAVGNFYDLTQLLPIKQDLKLRDDKMTKIQDAKKIIEEADKIVIGAGAGLSAAAGLTYSGSRFEVFFKDYIARYGMQDMYSAAFYPFETAEERWGYWAKHIYHNRYQPEGLSLYRDLFDLVKDKDYFVITTNVDGQFMKTGFAPFLVVRKSLIIEELSWRC